jgi:hypothetical protein
MKTRHYLLIVFLLGFFIQSLADGVPVKTAKQVAKNIYFERAPGELNLKYDDITANEAEVITRGNDTLIYIYNMNDGEGFAIIAAQDNVFPVLGYSYEGAYSADFHSQKNFTAWMNSYKKQIFYAVEYKLKPTIEIEVDWTHLSAAEFSPDILKSIVSPLISTKWGQGNGYNNKCPTLNGTPCKTGCVATAMAQLMNYWNCPAQGANVTTTWWWKRGHQSLYCNHHINYNWSSLDIPELMWQAGAGAKMNYGLIESGAETTDAVTSFKNDFKYSNSILYIHKNSYGSVDWENKMKEELDNNRPVLYGGYSHNGGHQWVLDGYIGSGNPCFFHFNWGWEGDADGYFYLTNLNPGTQNFTIDQDAVINIQPNDKFIKVNHPNGNELLHIIANDTIKWESSNFTEAVKIELVKNGVVYATLFNNTPNDGEEVWNIDNAPSGFTPDVGDDYKIRISQIGGDNLTDESDNNFEITDFEDIEITSPQSGQIWTIGGSYLITWNSAVTGVNLKIELCIGASVVSVLKNSTPDDGNETCQIPEVGISPGSSYRIKITKVIGATTYIDYSDNFDLQSPTISITSPKAGDEWVRGKQYKISWTSNFTDNITIQYAKGPLYSTWTDITTNIPNLSFCYVTFNTSTDEGDYKIKIKKDALTEAISNEFSIKSISVLHPTENADWAGGGNHSHLIEWVSDFDDEVDIEIFKNGISIRSYNNIVNGGHFLWQIPVVPQITWGDIYQIKVLRASDYTQFDTSPEFFNISAPYITVIYPNNAGEEIEMGHSVFLKTKTNISKNLIYELWRSGAKKKTLLTGSKTNQSNPLMNATYAFKPDKNVVEPGGGYKIKVVSGENGTVFGESANPFTLKGIIITNPDPGVSIPSYPNGANIPFTWNHNLDPAKKVNIKIIDPETGNVVNEMLNQDNDEAENVPVEDSFGNDLIVCKIYEIKIEYADDPLICHSAKFHVEDNMPTTNTWTGSTNDDWFEVTNWDLGELPNGNNVIIPNVSVLPIIAGGYASINDLLIEPDAGLTLSPDGYLTTWEQFTNDGYFQILSDGLGYSGSYIDQGGITGSGTFEFDRNIVNTAPTGDQSGWHYLSSPVSGFTSHGILDYWLNIWDETAHSWNHIEGIGPCTPDAPFALETLMGWSIKRDASYNCPSNPGTGEVIELIGPMSSLNSGAFQVPLTFTIGDYEGWNLLGNPYPSSIDPNAIIWGPNTDQSVYMWDGVLNTYVSWAGGIGPNIPPTQGFFVHVTANDNFSLFGNERMHDNGQYWFKSEISNLLKIETKSNEAEYYDVAYIHFLDEATPSFDSKWDAYKLLSGVPGVPQIYTTTSKDILSINSMPQTDMAPLYFEAGKSGTYTLEVTEANDFDTVILEDKFAGIKTDLLAGSYTFNFVEGNDANRFMLYFKDVQIGNDEYNMNIYSNMNNVFIMNTNHLQGEVNIYNLLGQQLTSLVLHSGRNVIILNEPQGIYLVKVKTTEKTQTKKVYIKQ